MRNFYGKWNEDRWLRSFRMFKKKPEYLKTADVRKQKYYIPLKSYKKKKHKKIIPKNWKKVPYPLVTTKKEDTPEVNYMKGVDNIMYHISNANDRREFTYIIPEEDPYLLKRNSRIDGGADVRFSMIKRTTGEGDETKLRRFLMNADIGLRWRPLGTRYNLVYESRFLGGPQGRPADEIVGNERTRALYFMVDDLDYNFYGQFGYYRPLFGHYTPDHYALAQIMTGVALSGAPYSLMYKTLSFGSAPNVPYFNVHVIMKNMTNLNADDKTSGGVLNAGVRGVTNGWNVNYSVWSTSDKTDSNNEVKVVMHSLYGGITFWQKLWLNLELLSLERDNPAQDFRRGGVYTFEGKYRFWREMYTQFAYAVANTDSSIKEGSASHTKVGVRAFLYPGWEVELDYNMTQNSPSGGESTKLNYFLANFHFFL